MTEKTDALKAIEVRQLSTREVYDKAVQMMCYEARRGFFHNVIFYAEIVRVFEQRLWQERMIEKENPFHVGSVLDQINGMDRTARAAREMKMDVEKYGSMFRADVIAGIGKPARGRMDESE